MDMKKYILSFFVVFLVFQACEKIEGYITKGIAEIDGRVESIEINWNDGPVYIYQSLDANVKFFEKAKVDLTEANSLSCRFVDGELEIFYGPGGKKDLGDLGKELYVYVPVSRQVEELEVNTSGFVHADLDSKEARITTNTGKIEYSNCLVKFDATLVTTSGDVEVSLPKKASFILDWQTESGQMYNNNFSLTEYEGLYKFGEGDSRISVRTVSGNLGLAERDE